jgi:chemotaxis protein MotB
MKQTKTEQEMAKVIKVVEESGMKESFDVFPTKEGFAVRISSPLLFNLGQADLRPEAQQVLLNLSDILKSFKNTIRVEGHTCDLPINTARFPSNWELSTARALTVLKFLHQKGIISERLSAVGYGEFRPLLPNTSPENRHANRRVEIYVNVTEEDKNALETLFLKENKDGR